MILSWIRSKDNAKNELPEFLVSALNRLEKETEEDFWTPMVARRRGNRIQYRDYIMVCLVFFKDGSHIFERCQPEMCAERRALQRILHSEIMVSDVNVFYVLKISVQDRRSIVLGASLPCSQCTQKLLNNDIDNVIAMNEKNILSLVYLPEHCPYVRLKMQYDDEVHVTCAPTTTPNMSPMASSP